MPLVLADSALIRAKRVADPVQLWRGRITAAFDHVEPAGCVRESGMAGQVGGCSEYQLGALACVHRGAAAAKRMCCAVTDFDKDQGVTLAHDQVQLATACADVAFDQQ